MTTASRWSAEQGELVCTAPFPSMPIYFWDDPDGKKYQTAYFDVYPGVWTHGDFIEITERGGVIMYGRSDATLNPGGVRIGTAEIYRSWSRWRRSTTASWSARNGKTTCGSSSLSS